MLKKIDQYLQNKYEKTEYPALDFQRNLWLKEKPLKGKRILDATPVFANTLLKYAAMIAAGADLTIGYSESIPYDPEIIHFLKKSGIPCRTDITEKGSFDAILDCNGVFRDLKPKYGFAELTRSGAYRFEGTADPVILVDDSRIKAIETCLGTGESFLRAMLHLGYHEIAGKKILVFGCGKVGRGVVFYAGRAGAEVIAVDDPSMVVRHVGGRLLDRANRAEVLAEMKQAWCIVSATGKRSALAEKEYLEIVRNGPQILANMGVEDEWGPSLPAERVLNRKAPLNFILPEPTLLRYIDPTMALHNHAAVELVNSESLPGIRKPSPVVEQNYWKITEENGLIAGELSAAGL